METASLQRWRRKTADVCNNACKTPCDSAVLAPLCMSKMNGYTPRKHPWSSESAPPSMKVCTSCARTKQTASCLWYTTQLTLQRTSISDWLRRVHPHSHVNAPNQRGHQADSVNESIRLVLRSFSAGAVNNLQIGVP